MKNNIVFLFVLSMLTPALAVNFSLVSDPGGTGKLTVNYNLSSGEVLRGMAVKINVLSGDARITDNTKVVMGALSGQLKYVFPDYAFTQGIGYSIGTGNPLAESSSAGILTSYPATQFSVCFGILDDGGSKAGLTDFGFFDIFFTLTTDSSVMVSVDSLRGGIVGDNLVVSNLPVSSSIAIPHTITTPSVTGSSSFVNNGQTVSFTATGAVCSQNHALEYQFFWDDGNVSPWGPASLNHVYYYGAAGSYNVTVKARCATDSNILSSVSVPFYLTREAVKTTAPFYQAWVTTFARPNCWAYKRNCRGDVDNRGTGFIPYKLWVNSVDLDVFMKAYNQPEYKLVNIIVNTTSGPIPGICADNNRQYTGFSVNRIWVNNADLSNFTAYYNKVESNIPACDQTNYNFWY